MRLRWLGICLASTAALGIHSAMAQPVNGCPEGQAMQSSDPSGRNVTCVPIPPPVDLTPLMNADAALLGAINDETQARIAADNELRASIGGEISIVGRYAFTGTQVCLSSSLGFNPNLTPVAAPFTPQPPPPLPGEPPPPPVQVVSAIVSSSTATVSGSRTFNADGTGTVESDFHVVNPPGFFFNSFGTGVTTGGPNFAPSGGASVSVLTGTFTWEVVEGKLIIQDSAVGTIAKGGTRVGWTLLTEGMPRAVGVLGKDLRVISTTQEDLAVEISILRSPEGQPFQEFRTPRICHRERTLRKM
jgi:hypothetical protein